MGVLQRIAGAVLDMHPVFAHDVRAEFDNFALHPDFFAVQLFSLGEEFFDGIAVFALSFRHGNVLERGDGSRAAA